MSESNLEERIRAAIEASGLSWYRVAKDTGVSESTISRFMAGEVDLRLSNAEKIADLLGLQIVGPKLRRPTKRKR